MKIINKAWRFALSHIRLIRHISLIGLINKFVSVASKRSLQAPLIKRLRRNRKKAFAFGLSLLVILSSLAAYLTFFAAKQASAAWFDDSWGYRKQITFGNSGSADSNKKVLFQLDTATLITAGKMQTSCQDARFTDANGALLRYYINVSGGAGVGCNDASSDFYVLMPTIVSGNNLLFFYYGSPSAPAGTESANFSQATFSPTSGPTTGSEEKGSSPQMYLKFDEGTDNTCSGGANDACDQTSNGNSGAISNGTAWKTEDLCMSGKCLYYDGTDDIVTVTNASSIDLDQQLAGAFTFQAWIRPNGAGEGTGGQIFYKGTNTWLRVDTLSNGKLDIEASLNLATPATLNVSAPVNDNQWNFVAVGYTDDGDDEITIYVNGNNVGSSTNGVGAPAADTNNLLIGGTTTNNFKGFIDEFKIYKTERTAAEIKTDFVKGTSSLHGVSAAYGIHDYSYLSDGLVGYWKIDEASGTSVADFSGNGLTGTAQDANIGNGDGDTPPPVTSGKFGNARNFDGTDDLINVGDQPTLELTTFTLSAWVYRTGTCGAFQSCNFISKGMSGNIGYALKADNSHSFKPLLSLKDGQQEVVANTIIATNTWYHVAASIDGNRAKVYVNGVLENDVAQTVIPSFDGQSFKIGNANSNNDLSMQGIIDEARVYNRALSEVEVRALYNWAPGPVGYWKLDENTGTTANDSSGNGNTTSTFTGNTTWATGKYGSALKFDGTDDVARIVETSSTDLGATTDSYTVSAWMKTTASGTTRTVVAKFDNVGLEKAFMLQLDNSNLACFDTTDSSGNNIKPCSVTAVNDGNWHFLTGVRDVASDKVSIFVDGILISSLTDVSVTTNANNDDISIGSGGSSYIENDFTGPIDDVKIYNYARSSSQIVEDMNAGHPAPGSPVGSPVIYWKFDEAYGTTTNNSGTDGSLDGTITSAEWNLENSTFNCKLNSCLNFLDSYSVSAGDVAFTDSLTSMTVSSWINPQQLGVNAALVSKSDLTATNNAFLIRADSTNSDEIRVYIGDNTDTADYFTTTNLDLTTGNWLHLAVVYDGTLSPSDRIKVYKNGRQASGSVTGTIPTSMDSATTAALRVGDSDIAGADGLAAYYDEIKIFNFALTQAQVYADATAGSAAALGGVLGTHDSEGFGGTPPVGWWKMDENTGTGADTVKDTSGSNNHLTTNNMEASDRVPGKYGSALVFDGTNEFLSRTDDADFDFGTASFTVEAWVKHNGVIATNEDYILTKADTTNGGYKLYMDNSGDFCFVTDDDTVWDTDDSACTSAIDYDDSSWHHVVGVKTTTTRLDLYVDGILVASDASIVDNLTLSNANSLYVGVDRDGTSNAWDGLIDSTRIYNYALSQAQVAYAYNRGGPIGYWKLDECQGTVANDSSGKGNNGTITPGAGTYTSAGTCSSGSGTEMWNNGGTGKRNYSLDFDGGDDFITITDNNVLDITGNFTISAWVQRTGGTGSYIMSKLNSATSGGYAMLIGDGGEVYCRTNDGVGSTDSYTATGIITTGSGWHHLTVARSGTSCRVYVDGIDKTSIAATHTTLTANALPLRIGDSNSGGEFWAGELDEVKLYNYALTADQVKRVYNQGAVFFGPATGSP